MRRSLLFLVALFCVACDDGGGTSTFISGDASVAPKPDANVQVVDAAIPDSSVIIEDASLDLDSEVLEEDASVVEDAGGIPGDRAYMPTYEQTTACTVEGNTYLMWWNGAAVMKRINDASFRWLGDPEVVGELDFEPSRIRSLTVNGIPFVAAGAEGHQIHVYQADVPDSAELVLDLYGEPVIAQAHDKLIVIAQTADGTLAWQLIGPDDTQTTLRPLIVDDGNIPMPDDAIGISAGVIFRNSDAGQCVYLDTDGLALGNFPCVIANGKFIGDGENALITHDTKVTSSIGSYNMSVRPLFGGEASTSYVAMRNGPSDYMRFQSVDGARVFMGENIRVGDPQMGAFQITVMDVNNMWLSEPTRGSSWEYPEARALVRKGDRLGIFRFGFDNSPVISFDNMTKREWIDDNDPYNLEVNRACTPSVEQCDGLDSDCNGETDNGLCCAATETPNGITHVFKPGADVQQLLVTDVGNADAYRIAVRTGESHWSFWVNYLAAEADEVKPFQRLQPDDSLQEFTIDTTDKALAFQAAGGCSALLTQKDDSTIRLYWHHASRNVHESVDFSCSKLLAMDTTHYVGSGGLDAQPGEDNSILAVCPEGIFRIFADASSHPDPISRFSFNGLGSEPNIQWATITRASNGVLTLLVSYISSSGTRQLSLYNFTSSANRLTPFSTMFNSLASLSSEDLEYPIQLHNNVTRAPIQILPGGHARVLINSPYGYRWQNVVGSANPSRVEYAVPAQKLVTSGPFMHNGVESTGFWVTDVTGEDGFNLWTTEPTFIWEGPEPLWAINRGAVQTDRSGIALDTQDIAVYIVPDENDAETWKLITRQVSCHDL